jgi:N6-L-threonylcarbamoyladenine synthase
MRDTVFTMKILGIETSCDETAAAVVEDGKRLLSNVVASSMDIHAQYGGVVPEIAARSHIESIMPVIEKALEEAGCSWAEIDAIAVTYGAGLGGCLLVGVMTARTLAITKNKPLYAINHVEAHVYANFLTAAGPAKPAAEPSSAHRLTSLADTALPSPLLAGSSPSTASSAAPDHLVSSQSPAPVRQWVLQGQTYLLPSHQPEFPLLALIVSGGHSQLVIFRNHFDYTLLGQTGDDAIGEAFDKVAKILGLPYPGGPSVEKAAQDGNPHTFEFPKAKLAAKYDYSFSGPKTAVLRAAQKLCSKSHDFPSFKLAELLTDAQKADVAASFQRVAVETVVDKTLLAFEEFSPKSVVIGGGVAASPELRRQLAERLPIPIEYTDMKLCTDNGAMIATLACFKMKMNQSAADPYTLDIQPNLSMQR